MPRHAPLAALTLGLALATSAHADEGMWMPSQMPELAAQLARAGFKGDPAALADLTQAPLSAVVRAGGGTGAFVSADGLVLTNHHVAYGVIQYNTPTQGSPTHGNQTRDGQPQRKAAQNRNNDQGNITDQNKTILDTKAGGCHE